jgi:hypothetical protein
VEKEWVVSRLFAWGPPYVISVVHSLGCFSFSGGVYPGPLGVCPCLLKTLCWWEQRTVLPFSMQPLVFPLSPVLPTSLAPGNGGDPSLV